MLITNRYRRQNKQLHAERPEYGSRGHRFAPACVAMIETVSATSFLDYGCGKGSLRPALQALLAGTPFTSCRLSEYDPAIEGKDARPEPADVVICNDVLEHVEPDCIEAVLDDLARVTAKIGLFMAVTGPGGMTLPDGRNVHLTQRPWLWWAEQLDRRFRVQSVVIDGSEVQFTVRPKQL